MRIISYWQVQFVPSDTAICPVPLPAQVAAVVQSEQYCIVPAIPTVPRLANVDKKFVHILFYSCPIPTQV